MKQRINWSNSSVRKQIGNERGSASLFLAVGVLALGLMFQSGDLGRTSTNAQLLTSSRMFAAKEALNSQLTRLASMPATFRASLDPSLGEINSAFNACMFGPSCAADGITEYPISLYLPAASGGQMLLVSGAGPVEGGKPALYDVQGNRCESSVTAANSKCPLEVFTTFVTSCPVGQAVPCPTQKFQIRYVHKCVQKQCLDH